MKTVEELKKKYDEEKGILITYDRKGRAYVSFNVGGVPLKQFEEWNDICESEFNSSRWQKIYLDHRMHLNFMALTQGPGEVKEEVAEATEKKKKEITLMSGETMKDE